MQNRTKLEMHVDSLHGQNMECVNGMFENMGLKPHQCKNVPARRTALPRRARRKHKQEEETSVSQLEGSSKSAHAESTPESFEVSGHLSEKEEEATKEGWLEDEAKADGRQCETVRECRRRRGL